MNMKKIIKVINSVCSESARGLNLEIEDILHVGCRDAELSDELGNSFYPANVDVLHDNEEQLKNNTKRSRVDTVNHNLYNNLLDVQKEYEDYDMCVFSTYPPFNNYDIESFFEFSYNILDYNSLLFFLIIEDEEIRNSIDNYLDVKEYSNDKFEELLINSNFNYIKKESFSINKNDLNNYLCDNLDIDIDKDNIKISMFLSMKV